MVILAVLDTSACCTWQLGSQSWASGVVLKDLTTVGPGSVYPDKVIFSE